MSSGFRIDLDQAESMLRKLEECAERMQQARKKLKNVGPKTLGTNGLDNACEHFQDEWEDGITRIEDASKDIKERLKTTLDAYKAGEDANRKGMGAK